jgi:hypothetical protein
MLFRVCIAFLCGGGGGSSPWNRQIHVTSRLPFMPHNGEFTILGTINRRSLEGSRSDLLTSRIPRYVYNYQLCVTWICSLYVILPAALWPWDWLSLWQKWVPRMRGRRVRLDNLTAICELIGYKMWELRRLTTLWAITAVTGIKTKLNSVVIVRKRTIPT